MSWSGLTEGSHLSNAYTGYSDAEKLADRKAAEQAIMDISEDTSMIDYMEKWAAEEPVSYKPFFGEEPNEEKQELDRASRTMGRPKKRREVSGLDFHFLSESAIQIASPTACGETILPTPSEVERVSKIHKKQIKPRGVKKKSEPEPVKLEPCETFEEVKRWMEIAHPEYITDEMMANIETKCRNIEKEF